MRLCTNPEQTLVIAGCKISRTVQAVWNGPLLYLLFTVTNSHIDASSPVETKRSGVQILVDHSLKPSQAANIVKFADMVLFGKPLADDVKKHLTTDPYLDAGTYDTYYGGLRTMMPWAGAVGGASGR